MNPFTGKELFVPKTQADHYLAAYPSLSRITAQPTCIWLGEWNTDLQHDVQKIMQQSNGTLPVFVLYNIPQRDVNQYSKGGAKDDATYLAWIDHVITGVGTGNAAVILEPDAVTHMLHENYVQDNRAHLLKNALEKMRSKSIPVYLDAGNPWYDPAKVIPLLDACGIMHAQGFAVNVSNFYTTDECIAYGKIIAEHFGKHFIIDTSRNGNGTYNGEVFWCNPPGRALGNNPAASPHPLVDAFLWVKTPGESDGEYRGGPKAGTFWPEYALELVKNAK